MRASILAVVAACLVATAGCESDGGPAAEPQAHAIRPMTKHSITIRRGGSATLEVTIDRERHAGPVTVSIAPLPDGVTTDVASKQVDATGTTFVLTASPKADLVKGHTMGVEVEDASGHTSAQNIKVNVTD